MIWIFERWRYSDYSIIRIFDGPKKFVYSKIRWFRNVRFRLYGNSKKKLSNATLYSTGQKRPFIIHNDASNLRIRAVLCQGADKMLHPLYFASNKLWIAEKRYHITDLEALVIDFALIKSSTISCLEWKQSYVQSSPDHIFKKQCFPTSNHEFFEGANARFDHNACRGRSK